MFEAAQGPDETNQIWLFDLEDVEDLWEYEWHDLVDTTDTHGDEPREDAADVHEGDHGCIELA